VGRQVQFSANRACPVYVELASILRKTSGVVDVLAEVLLPLEAGIEAAFVYGSVASGKANSGSDIDVLVIGSVGFAELVVALHPVQETLGREINPKVYSRSEWRKLFKAQGSFVRDVMSRPRLYVVGGDQDVMEDA